MASTTGFENDNVGAFIRKDPGSTLDYTIDWTDWLGDDTISSVSYAITSDAETSPVLATSTAIGGEATSVSGKTTKINLTAGTSGGVYTVTATLTTSGSRIVKRSFRVKVETIHL